MIMAYTTDPFRVSIIGLIYIFLLVKVTGEKYSSWVFCAFCRNFKQDNKDGFGLLNSSLLLLFYLVCFIKPQSSLYLFAGRWQWNHREIRHRGCVRWPLFLPFEEQRGVT